jgi:hypothetical protein
MTIQVGLYPTQEQRRERIGQLLDQYRQRLGEIRATLRSLPEGQQSISEHERNALVAQLLLHIGSFQAGEDAAFAMGYAKRIVEEIKEKSAPILLREEANEIERHVQRLDGKMQDLSANPHEGSAEGIV